MRHRRREEQSTRRDAPPLPGVIDTVGLGYSTVAARPFVILPLLALELVLLFVPQLKLQPLTSGIADAARDRGSAWNELAREVETFAEYNAIELSALRAPLLHMPALIPVAREDAIDGLPWTSSYGNAPVWLVLGAGALAIGVGLLIAALYQLLAAAATGARSVAETLRPRVTATMARDLAVWLAAMFGMLSLIAWPMVVLTVLGVAFGFAEVALVWILLAIPFVWGYIHFYFSIPALALERAGAARSLRSSYRVVRSSFWQSMQLIAITLLVTTGLTYALQQLATSMAGVLLAIVLNAVVVTGLLIAAMLFYRDRAARLDPTSIRPGR